ncbi:MAG: hypothetical protein LBM98_05140 [Oscillospiraceae bacterium]|nr:hypothetical protein [Oscillospiraceae bacterium]
MKNFKTLAVLAIALLLAACGTGEQPVQPTPIETPGLIATAEPTETPIAADSFNFQDFTITAVDGESGAETVTRFLTEYYAVLETLPQEDIQAVKSFELVDLTTEANYNALIGRFSEAVEPYNPDNMYWWAGNSRQGEGEFSDSIIRYAEIKLYLDDDGIWRCNDAGTGGVSFKHYLEEAQELAKTYVENLRGGLDISEDDRSIEAFDALFDRSKLQAKYIGEAENIPDTYVYGITDNERSVALNVSFQKEPPALYCAFASYYSRVCHTLDLYLEKLEAKEVANFTEWYIDDLPAYSEAEAVKLLDYYSRYDLSEFSIEAWDYSEENYPQYTASLRDANGTEFEIVIACGDGLAYIDDRAIVGA